MCQSIIIFQTEQTISLEYWRKHETTLDLSKHVFGILFNKPDHRRSRYWHSIGIIILWFAQLLAFSKVPRSFWFNFPACVIH